MKHIRSALWASFIRCSLSEDDSFEFPKNANTQIPPFNTRIDLVIDQVNDSDSVGNSGADTILTPASVEIRFGRVRMENAFGSELVDLIMHYNIEFYNEYSGGSGYWTRHDDADTTILTADISAITGPGPGTTVVNGVAPTIPALLGKFDITLMAPGTAYVETITTNLGAVPWLRFDWDAGGIFNDDPFALATFGIFDGDPVQIYIQQIYQD